MAPGRFSVNRDDLGRSYTGPTPGPYSINNNTAAMLTESRVKDQNAINALANEIEGHVLRLLSPYKGFKTRKISGHGGNVAKLQAEFDRYCLDHGYNQPGQPLWICLRASFTSLIVSIRNTAVPISADLYVGRFNNETGVLTHLGNGTTRRTDYTLTEVEQALAGANQLEEQARALRSTVQAFTRR
jgi:hypothetical protein